MILLIFFSLITFLSLLCFFFFFNDTATTEIYTLSLHDALPISAGGPRASWRSPGRNSCRWPRRRTAGRSEEHTSELQSQSNLVCRLLLEKKKNNILSNQQYLDSEMQRSVTHESNYNSHTRTRIV